MNESVINVWRPVLIVLGYEAMGTQPQGNSLWPTSANCWSRNINSYVNNEGDMDQVKGMDGLPLHTAVIQALRLSRDMEGTSRLAFSGLSPTQSKDQFGWNRDRKDLIRFLHGLSRLDGIDIKHILCIENLNFKTIIRGSIQWNSYSWMLKYRFAST